MCVYSGIGDKQLSLICRKNSFCQAIEVS